MFDTGALFDDPALAGKRSQLLLKWAGADGAYSLVLPEVVVRELVNDAREQFEKASGRVASARRIVERLGGSLTLAPPSSDDLTQAFETRLRQAVEENGGTIAPLPDVPHSDLVSRSVRGRKPFSSSAIGSKEPSDRGYRDALIWHTVLRLVGESDEKIVLVTRNERDFGTEELLLPDLQADLADPGRVELCGSVEDFLGKHLPLDGQVFEKFSGRLESDAVYAGNVRDAARSVLLAPHDWGRDYVDFVQLKDPASRGQYGPDSIELSDVRVASTAPIHAFGFGNQDPEGIVEIEVAAELVADLAFSRGDAEWIEELGAKVDLYDWAAESYVLGAASPDVLARIYLLLDRETLEIKEAEVLHVTDAAI